MPYWATAFAMPDLYFHVATAHGLLRHKGIEIGKLDYWGWQPCE
ncbi:DUF1993 family protein [Acidisphaera sp. S103]